MHPNALASQQAASIPLHGQLESNGQTEFEKLQKYHKSNMWTLLARCWAIQTVAITVGQLFKQLPLPLLGYLSS